MAMNLRKYHIARTVDAVRMLLVRVAAEKALPFDVKAPNPATAKAMRAADEGKGKRRRSAGDLFKDLGI
jgi:DNA-damage-inducible protein J